ncbi:MAG: hypothetical protein ABWZ80_00135 [Beijerinckiaceae bacterium]
MDKITSLFQTVVDKPEVILGALAGLLALIYAGLFRGLGVFISRFTTPILMGWWFYSRSDNPSKLNITLNILTREHLDIDTIVADRLLTDVYKNHFIAQIIKQAAKRTTIANPIITLRAKPSAWRRWLRFSHKTEAMRTFRFVLALTYERGIPGRDQHFRCMMTHEDALRNLPALCPPVDHPQYATRFKTLQCIAATYAKHPERFGVVKLWLPEGWIDPPSP